MMKKRLKLLGAGLFLLLFLLIGRLVQIQLVSTESFSKHKVNLIEASVTQRSQVLEIDDGRGKFYDRNGMALAHEEIPTLVLFPFLKKMDWPSDKVADIAGVDQQQLEEEVEKSKDPFVVGGKKNPVTLTKSQSEAINSLKIPGVFAVNQKLANDQIPAAQLIGTTTKSDPVKQQRYPDLNLSPETKVGDTGLQRTFDEFLMSNGESKLVYHVDASGGPMFGVDVKYVEPANPLYPVKIMTTIDKEIQEIAEKAVDQHNIKKGGLVLIDIEKNEIAAMVSRPALDSKNPHGDGTINMMTAQKTPGSIFKVVTAAAAIENDAAPISRRFNCDLTIDGKTDQQRSLGFLDFEQSFAQSCNRAFGELSQELSEKEPDFLQQYAEKLGLIGQNGWSGDVYHANVTQLYREQKGVVWLKENLKKDKRMIAKTAIGQQDVQVTPLAVANMMATIARGGEKQSVKAVSRVEFNNGATVFDFPEKQLEGDSISSFGAMKLQKLLRSVVQSPKGTGVSLSGLPYEVAGKSGTAQTDLEKKELNKWFAGYFPYKKPKYALVVVSLETKEEAGGVTPIFAEIVKELYTHDRQR
ncbi:penicillin-binding transpeptidase domain-containing protein [Bacillus massiliglaciei]|uniref:penicillin-binding transpeptidase domain-containing protein n=1 Tax=Bacillus massiliglaciei TaxID=1816693 RepID=UPI000A5CCE7E|nr:penicillin-binding transpeptidase domain-containing protein [Bacillus massiliglaciei]